MDGNGADKMQLPVYISEPGDDTSSFDEVQAEAYRHTTESGPIRWRVPRPGKPEPPRLPTESEVRGKKNRHIRWSARNKAAKKARRRNRH